MALGPVEMNGMISRTQDITTIKQNQDNKAFVDQSNIKTNMEQNVDHKLHQVHDADNSRDSEGEFDAKREGRNKYVKLQKKKKEKTEGKVVVKQRGGFDMTV